MPMERSKDELLEEASHERKVPQWFCQMDGHVGYSDGTDSVMQGDDDGDVLMSGFTQELRASGPSVAVRIYVHEDTTPETARRLVSKWLEHIERDCVEAPEGMTYGEIKRLEEMRSIHDFRERRAQRSGDLDGDGLPY